MSQVAITKVNGGKKDLPIFDEIAKRFQAVQKHAFDLFENRGRQLGHELEDWLKAEHDIFGWPSAEMAEKDGAYEMQIALPGFDANEVQVTAALNEIIVHAASEKEKKTKKGEVLWTEFGSNDVYRRFEVPNAIEVDKVTAKIENGLLRINAPEVIKQKEITAKAAA